MCMQKKVCSHHTMAFGMAFEAFCVCPEAGPEPVFSNLF